MPQLAGLHDDGLADLACFVRACVLDEDDAANVVELATCGWPQCAKRRRIDSVRAIREHLGKAYATRLRDSS